MDTRRRFVPQQEAKVWDLGKAADDSPERKEDPGRDGAKAIVERVRSGGFSFPMLPGAAQEAMGLAGDPSASMQSIMKAVGPDPVLAAKVLRLANSPTYSRGAALTSLQAALQRLGTGAIRDVLWQAVSEAHIFRGEDARWLNAERQHALAVAHIARFVATEIGADTEGVLAAGLLHDIGRVIAKGAATGIVEDEAVAARAIELAHVGIGRVTASEWELPALVRQAIARHHRYAPRGTVPYSKIGNLVAVAEVVAEKAVFPMGSHHLRASAPADLGLEPEQLERIVAQATALRSA